MKRSVEVALEAWSRRPTRAEPIADLAEHYRKLGNHAAAVLFAEQAMGTPLPQHDSLFIETSAYGWRPRQDFAISGWYVPDRREAAAKVCNELALDRDVPDSVRSTAFCNLHFYMRPVLELCPSWRAALLSGRDSVAAWLPPDGWLPNNPSITRYRDGFLMVQRTVNYVCELNGAHGYWADNPENIIRTRNWIMRLTADLKPVEVGEIMPPAEWPDEPAYAQVRGFEDMRLYVDDGKLMTVSTVRELNKQGWCQQVRAELDLATGDLFHEGIISQQPPVRHEKNWMPIADGSGRLIYLCDPGRIVDRNGRQVGSEAPAPVFAETFRGGSQAVKWLQPDHDGAGSTIEGLLALIHEAEWRDGKPYYRHRFVLFDRDGKLLRCSPPFYFQHHGIEFAAGLAWHPDGDRLVVSYGVRDSESWIGTVEASEVAALLR